MPHTGAVIKAARKAQNLSLRELAETSGVDFTTISRIERGLVNPPPRTVKALTEALGQHLGGAA